MNTKHRATTQSGFTLTEVLIASAVMTAVSAGVFALLTQVMIFSLQEENYQNLRNDLLLTQAKMRKDIQMATNVVDRVGPLYAGSNTLILRVPATDALGEIIEDSFQFVSYRSENPGSENGGLVRQVWADQEDVEPIQSDVLNTNIIALGFLYGGQNFGSVTTLVTVRDVQTILVSARETGLQIPGDQVVSEDSFADLAILNEMMGYGLDFQYVRIFIDMMNHNRVDIVLSATASAATMRNQKALGLPLMTEESAS